MRAHTLTARILAAGWLAALAGGAGAQQPQPEPPPPAPVDRELRHFQVAATASPIHIDGTLDEAEWAGATVIDLPYEWYPGDNTAPPVKTEALVTFDSDNLYVAFKADDPEPGAIRSNLMDRDLVGQFVQDDHVGFTIDTFNDERQGYQFRVNPRGVQVDGVFSEIAGGEDFSWDAIWASAARVTDTGYVVEIAVPFRAIRFSRATGPQTWGLEAFRNYPRNVRHRISSKYSDRAKDCTLCQENKVTGFQGIAPGRNLELTPTLTATRSDAIDRFPNGELQKGDEEFEPGITAKWGITPNATLNATINPDFSQVEADALQLDVNTRFALAYPEKRPFFLEGADLYLTPLEAVFTRTVAEPDWGVKFNAKEGKNGLGLFITRDDINNIIIPSNQASRRIFLDQKVETGVARYRRDIGERSVIGVLYTGREGDEYHNRVGGLDGLFRFTSSDTVRMQYLRSDTLYPEGVASRFGQDLDGFGGYGLQAQYDHFSKVWKAFVRYQDLNPEFRADSGFIPRVDVKTSEAQYERFFYGTKETWYAQMTAGVHGLRTEDHGGLLTDQNFELFGTLNGPYQSAVVTRVQRIKEFFDGVTFDQDRQIVTFGISPNRRMRFELYGRFGNEIDYATGRLGDTVLLDPVLQFRLGSGLNLQFEYVRQNLDVDGDRAFTVDLAQSRVVYQFNVRTFVRAILQYQNFNRDGEYQKDFFGQFLFAYKINPQTVLFAGYTDGRAGVNEVDVLQTDRSFFLKVGYALLF
jgi:hypothetical protein